MGYKVSKFNYLINCEDGTMRMYNSLTGIDSLMIVDSPTKESVFSVLSGASSVDDISAEIREELLKRGYLVSQNKDEDYAVKLNMLETIYDEKYLNLIIMPTEQCNFRCKYCYETFEKGKMSSTLQEAIIKYVKKNILDYTGLCVVWFGGEPLMALDVIEYLSENFIKICKAAKRQYVSGMSTNGYNLTTDVFARLYKLKVLEYQITLDGVKTQHDNQRILANGNGTFDRIVDNLIQIKSKRALGAVFTIRTNFTKSIIENIDEYLMFYKQNFGDDARFSLYVKQAGDWGGERVKSFSGELTESVQAYVLNKAKEYGITFGNSGHFKELQCGWSTCYAAKRNNYVIGSDGTIYKCTVHFEMPENRVGRLDVDGFMELNDNIIKWIMPFAESENKCSGCFYKANCFPIKCPYEYILSGKSGCPPMGGASFGAYLERFQDRLFFRLEPND